ncbi:MAG: hypothetical protein AB1390_04190 [Nitrospirota bacterium]
MTAGSFLSALVLGFVLGIVFVYFLMRFRRIKLDRVDSKTLLFRLPLLGILEAEDPKGHGGIFIRDVTEDIEKIELFQDLLNFDLMMRYARDYNLNYIGTEGDRNGKWSDGRLAYTTLARGLSGGYNIYLNPDLDRLSVSKRLSEQIGVEIRPDELYTFLFLHEIGHTTKAGNECFLTALINHSLSGGRRSAKRRKMLKDLHLKVEKIADDFAVKELFKIRQKGLN